MGRNHEKSYDFGEPGLLGENLTCEETVRLSTPPEHHEYSGSYHKTDQVNFSDSWQQGIIVLQESNGRPVWNFNDKCLWLSHFSHWWTGPCKGYNSSYLIIISVALFRNLDQNSGLAWLENMTRCPNDATNQVNETWHQHVDQIKVWKRGGSNEILPQMKATTAGDSLGGMDV